MSARTPQLPVDRCRVILLSLVLPTGESCEIQEILRDRPIGNVLTLMNEKEFNEIEEQLRTDPLPSCPANLEQNVLRRIRLAKGGKAELLDWLGSWLTRPAFLAATLAIVVVSSFATASLLSRSGVAEDPVAALGFDVFSDPISLPTDH